MITAQPADVQVSAGSSAQFSVVASGGDLAYQWQRSMDAGSTWSAVGGATGASYTLSGAAVTDSGSRFRVLVSRGATSTPSSAATLTVLALAVAPAITVQPQNVQAYVGATANFSVTATGTSLSYRWQTRPVGGDWTDVAQATQPTLQLPALTLADDQRGVRVLITNTAGSLTSDTATLGVQPVPAALQFTSQPVAASVAVGATATFSAVATGNPVPTLQWQRSSDGGNSFTDITGAIGSSYTTSATTLADNGLRLRVVARNASGSVTSDVVLLTVTAAATAPAITKHPVATSGFANQTVSFTAAASGTPAPAYQWQVSTDGGASFANINGANTGTLSFTATMADDLKMFRVVATNSAGSVTSRSVILSMFAQVPNASGRSWAPGRQLESGDGEVSSLSAATMDDQGTVAVIFGKHDGTRVALYAVRGVQDTKGTTWSTPVVIDAGAFFDNANTVALATSPNGNLVASWTTRAACTASTYVPAGTCNYVVSARYLAASGTWQAPAVVGDSTQPGFSASINDAGDAVGVFDSWTRNSLNVLSVARALVWMPAGQSAWQGRVFQLDTSADSFSPQVAAVDGSGSFHVLGTGLRSGSSSVDVVAYRGTVSTGLGTRQVVDTFAAAPTVLAVFANPSGAVAGLWQGSRTLGARAYGTLGALDAGSSAWQLRDTGVSFTGGYATAATLTNEGEFIAHSISRCTSLRRLPGTQAAEVSLPSPLCNSVSVNVAAMAVARNGDFLLVSTASSSVPEGRWLTYDARLRQQTDSFTPDLGGGVGYVLNFPGLPAGVPLLSSVGVGAYVSRNVYDVLPSSAGPGGNTRGVYSLWGWSLR